MALNFIAGSIQYAYRKKRCGKHKQYGCHSAFFLLFSKKFPPKNVSTLATQIFFLVFEWGDTSDLFKMTVKIRDIIKSTFKTNDICGDFILYQ